MYTYCYREMVHFEFCRPIWVLSNLSFWMRLYIILDEIVYQYHFNPVIDISDNFSVNFRDFGHFKFWRLFFSWKFRNFTRFSSPCPVLEISAIWIFCIKLISHFGWGCIYVSLWPYRPSTIFNVRYITLFSRYRPCSIMSAVLTKAFKWPNNCHISARHSLQQKLVSLRKVIYLSV